MTIRVAETPASPSSSRDPASAGRFRVYWDFVRPFTLLPPMLGMVSGALTAIGAEAHRNGHGFFSEFVHLGPLYYAWRIVLGALMAATLNGASNVINQLYDLENDRINKPNRPLPAGKVTVRETKLLFLGLYALALAEAWFLGPPGDKLTFWIVVVAAAITYVYSAPPFRTKRWGLAANFTIAVPRGFLLKVAGWSSVAVAWGDAEPWYIGIIFFTFLLGASTTKDYSDMEGDKAARCITLPLRYGVKRSAWMIAPFFVLPWVMIPAGAFARVLSGNLSLLVGLGLVLMAYGVFIDWLILRNPHALAEEGENHPSWTHMYKMMMVAQIGFAASYVFV